MADFCKQCSIENFGEDFRDLADWLPPEEKETPGLLVRVLCEGCGATVVDNNGKCHGHCLLNHAEQNKEKDSDGDS